MSGYSANLTRELFKLITHRHSAVRLCCISTIQSLIFSDISGFDDLLPGLQLLSRDPSPSVRRTLCSMLAKLCCDLEDRYSIAPKVLPVHLSFFYDEVPELRQLAKVSMDSIGRQYEKDWPDRVKSELDLTPLVDDQNEIRVGSRHICRENSTKILEHISQMASSWSVDEQLQAIASLKSLVNHTEFFITGYVAKILQMFKKMKNETNSVRIFECCELLGHFIDPTVFLDSLIKMENSSDKSLFSLQMLTSFCRGSTQISKVEENQRPHMVLVLECLFSNFDVESKDYLDNLVSLCQVLVEKLQGASKETLGKEAYLLYRAIIFLKSSMNDSKKVFFFTNLIHLAQ
jgi:hypothetical protein